MKKLILIFLVMLISCVNQSNENDDHKDKIIRDSSFMDGVDLSYVNEMEDCGATYKNLNNNFEDVFHIFKNSGAEIIRVRLWNNPKWTNYSNLDDVKKTIRRSKELGMKVLLDFHYSDTWADPKKQIIPKDWENSIGKTIELGGLLYSYTQSVLKELVQENLKPDIVQVGNEINIMLLQEENNHSEKIDWNRNSYLINKGISAIRDLNQEIEIMLHIAQPENALWWFSEASQNGIDNYDWIGISYYPKWSSVNLIDLDQSIKNLIETYNKKLMVVETAYPYTMKNIDDANNILDENSLISGYPATIEGQQNYLIDLKNKIISGGGSGLIYWEPAWVSTNCKTLWGTGSHWENATLFDLSNKAIDGISFMK